MERKIGLIFAAVLVAALMGVSACGGGATPTPTPVAKPAATMAPAAPAATKPAAPTAAAQPAAVAASQGNPTAGKAVFDQYCNGCHPNGNQGTGPALRGRNLSADRIKTQVRNGGGGMPAFSTGQISDQQLNDLVAYVQSLQ